MDSDDEHDLAMRSGEPTDKAAYAYEVQDVDSSDDEQNRGPWRPIAPVHTTPRITFSAAAYPTIVSDASSSAAAATPAASTSSNATSASTSAAAASASRSVSGATVVHPADDDEVEGYEDEDASEDDASEEEEEEEEDEELGGNEGDRRFQAMLKQMQGKGGAADTQDPDLLSQILKGGSSSWKPSQRTEVDAGDQDDNAARVAEEQIDYQIYSDSLLAPLAAGLAEIELAALRTAILQFMAPTTADYVWQKEGMQLQVCVPHTHAAPAAASTSASSTHPPPRRSAFTSKHTSSHSQLLPHLHGTCHFGDNIEDEWFIVYLLLTLSSLYADLSICVSDSDGSFLCIELAEQLPEWIKPESAQHRVWIRRGQVHLIPVPQTPAQVVLLPTRPTIDEALKLLNSQAVPTAASSAVQTALLQKLEPFFRASASAAPSFSLASPSLSASHHTRVALPLSLALLLARYPQLVAEWSNNFFYRDAIDMKKANKMERVFGHAKMKDWPAGSSNGEEAESKMQDDAGASSSAAPAAASSSDSSASTDESAVPFVFLRVRFTHCLYAQLIQQRFAAPRAFARHLGALTSTLGSSASSPLVARALDLGVKLTTGAEMWFHNQKSEVARQLTKVTVARTKLGPQHPDLARRDEAARVALAATTQQFHSVTEIEQFLNVNAAKDQQAAVLEQWRTFSAAVDTRQAATLFSTQSGVPACNSPLFCRSLLSSFLYLCYQPHHCVDHEGADEIARDPTQLPLFDPARIPMQPEAQERRSDNPINLPFPTRLLELVEQLTVAYHTHSAESAAAPAAFTSLAAALQSTSFASLPRDDPDDWLSLTPAQLESMLTKATAAAAAADDDRADQKSDFDGAAIVDSMHRFVGKVSEVEGVEAPKAKGVAAKSAAFANVTKPVAPVQPQSRPLNVNSDELMRLLASAQATLATPAPAPPAASDSAMVDVPAPAAPSKKPARASIWDETIDEPIDPRDPPPTKENTRPPANNPYAAAFGPSTPESMVGAPPAQAVPVSGQAPAASASSTAAPAESQPQLRDYMDAMDDELQQAGLQSDFVRESDAASIASGTGAAASSSAPSRSTGAVNVDVNLLSNLLRSYESESQQGWSHTGPVTSILGSMGMQLPHNQDTAEKRK